MRNVTKLIGIAALLPLAACVTTTPAGQNVQLSEDVLRVLAPGQDTSQVVVQDDGCYWWNYAGVVEDTYIPLETRDGRMICTRGEGTPVSDL